MTGTSPQTAVAAAFAGARQAVQPYPAGRFEGRGIVICAGGTRLFTCAWICIGMLRRVLGCTLPIEVWHLGPEEMGPAMRGMLAELGAQTIDAHEVARRHGAEVLGGWEMKAYALLHSRFREMLLLDADNVPIVDPEFLFDCEEFRRTGTVFWPDLVRIRRDSPIWAMCGVPYRDTPSVESGQLLIDKQRAWPGLVLANWMNQHSDAFYDIVHGDKDTFLLAWLAQGTDFAMVQRAPRQLPHVICQRGFDGAVLFQHRNGAKWILLGRNPKIEGFAYERECFDLLRELGQQWDGCIFLPPPRSERAHEVERALASQRAFRFERVSADVRAIELLPDHRIGPAPGGDGIYWHVEEGTEGLALVFTAGGRVSCSMEPSPHGGWQAGLSHV